MNNYQTGDSAYSQNGATYQTADPTQYEDAKSMVQAYSAKGDSGGSGIIQAPTMRILP